MPSPPQLQNWARHVCFKMYEISWTVVAERRVSIGSMSVRLGEESEAEGSIVLKEMGEA